VASKIAVLFIVDVAQASVIRELFVPVVLRIGRLAFSADGSRLLVAGEAGVTWIDTDTWRVADAIPVPSPAAGWRDVTVDPAGRWAALGGTSGAYLIDLVHGGEPVRLTDSAVSSLSFDGSGGRLAAATRDGALVWDTEGGDQIRRVEVEGVRAVALSPDGSTLLIGRVDGEAVLWDLTSGSEIAPLIGHDGAILAAEFHPAGTRVYTAGLDGFTRSWRVPSEIQPITTDPALGLSGQGGVIATATAGGVAFLDAQTGEAISTFAAAGSGGCGGVPSAIRISADGTLAVATHAAGCVTGIDVATGVPLWVQDLAAEADSAPSSDPEAWVSPDGRSVLMTLRVRAGVVSSELRLLDAGTGEELWSEITGANRIDEADFSDVGSLVFLSGRYGALGAALYDVADGSTVCPAEASDRVTDVTSIPGGGFALATIDGVQILDETCAEMDVGELTSRPAPVQEIAIRPDGEVVATLGNDGEIRFWDAATGNLLGSAPGAGGEIAFDPGGRLLVGGPEGVSRVTCECGGFDELLSLARERVTRALTPEERATYL
jgi:WD40 repeat protein